MKQVKLTFSNNQIDFIENYTVYGFKDKSSLVRKALEHFQKEIELRNMKKSANIYAEIYNSDKELQNLTDSALTDWPK